jgi:hypothetical protein
MVESMPNETSQSQDAVLGGDCPAPLAGLVLGGLSGLQQQFGAQDIGVQIAALVNAVDFGDEAISLLLQGLNSEVLQIRGIAYDLLKQIGSPAAIAAAGEGVPLKVGDRIYGVYRSRISYGDDWYSIDTSVYEGWEEQDNPIYRYVVRNMDTEFFYITDDPDNDSDSYYYNNDEGSYDNEDYTNDDDYFADLLKFYTIQIEAKERAEKEFKQELLSRSARFNEIYHDHYPDNLELVRWCKRNGIEFSPVTTDGTVDESARLLDLLKQKRKPDLMYDLWSHLEYTPLAFVHEHVIDRPCYLRMAAV